MSKTRVWVLGVVAAMLVVIVGGWTLGISPVFAQITAANAQLTSAQSSAQSSQIQLATLKSEYGNIGKLKTKLNQLRLSVPETEAASVFINEITALGVSSGVSLQTVTIAAATLYSAAGTTASSTAATSTTSTSTATPAPATTTTTPAATATTTSSGLVLIPVTITVQGPFEATRLFTGALQTGARLLIASSVTMTTDPSTGTVTASVSGDIFSLPGTSDPSPKTKLVPTPTATATPTATPTPTATSTTASTSKTGSSGTTPNTAPTTQPTTDPTPDPTPTS